jgi:hypothetical protein
MYRIIGADQKQYGPVSADEVRQWIAEGRANAQTLIQAEGQTDWRPLSSFPEFATVAQPIPSGTPLTAGISPGNAETLVSGPATGLMVVGVICVLAAVLSLASNIFGLGMGAFGPGGRGGGGGMPPQMERWVQMTSGGVGIVLNIIGLALSGFFIYASTKMRKLENYGLVMTATIISMLPCLSPCCCVGLPVGIWILIVLSKPEVKSAFH